MKKPKVLIVNPDEEFLKNCTSSIRPFSDVITSNILNADILNFNIFTHIIIDGNEVLAKNIRKTFTGIMIANSSHDRFNDLMMAAGCDYKCLKEKTSDLFLSIIDLDAPECPIISVIGNQEDAEIYLSGLLQDFITLAVIPGKEEEIEKSFSKMKEFVQKTNRPPVKEGLLNIEKRLTEIKAGLKECQQDGYLQCLKDLNEVIIEMHLKL